MDYDTMRRSLAMRDALVEEIRKIQDPAAPVTVRASKTHARAIAESLMLGGYVDLGALAVVVDDEADDLEDGE